MNPKMELFSVVNVGFRDRVGPSLQYVSKLPNEEYWSGANVCIIMRLAKSRQRHHVEGNKTVDPNDERMEPEDHSNA